MAYIKSVIDQNLEGVAEKLSMPHPLEFQNQNGLAGSIFELHPQNFVKIYIYWISTNDSKTIFC